MKSDRPNRAVIEDLLMAASLVRCSPFIRGCWPSCGPTVSWAHTSLSWQDRDPVRLLGRLMKELRSESFMSVLQ